MCRYSVCDPVCARIRLRSGFLRHSMRSLVHVETARDYVENEWQRLPHALQRHKGWTMTIAFTRAGLGQLLAKTFDQRVQTNSYSFPAVEPRGQTLLMAADFGGQHKGQHFDTYAFLVFDLDRNERWLTGQRLFRRNVMSNGRRMAFKSMNDKYRRRALVPFLQLADHIQGWLVLFAVSKVGGSLFGKAGDSDENEYLLKSWKPRVRERLLRVMHFSAFLLSGLSSPNQDVLWIIDKDEVAANVQQLTQLTQVLARISSNSLSHELRHLRCGTTHSDDGSLSLEDLIAVCDLGAGAFCEVATAMITQRKLPRRGIVTPLPTELSWKTRLLASWLAVDNRPLQRLSCLIELSASSSQLQTTMMRWHTVPGQTILPWRNWTNGPG